MKISIGSDHRGVDLKSRVITLLEQVGHTFDDCGAYNSDSCDYPDIAHKVAGKVASDDCQRGILICGSGIGMSIAANKSPGVRAALCHDTQAAEMSRRHNNANVLCLSADRRKRWTIPNSKPSSKPGWKRSSREGVTSVGSTKSN